jgi:hypothetical protein
MPCGSPGYTLKVPFLTSFTERGAESAIGTQRFTNAGHEALAVLTAHVTASGKLGKESQGTRHQGKDFEVTLHVGGLTSVAERQRDQHLRWGHDHLRDIPDVRVRLVRSIGQKGPGADSRGT